MHRVQRRRDKFSESRVSGGMADALASGASVRKDVGVQVPPHARRSVLTDSRRPRPGSGRGLLRGGSALPQAAADLGPGPRPPAGLAPVPPDVDEGCRDAGQRPRPGARSPGGLSRTRDLHPRGAGGGAVQAVCRAPPRADQIRTESPLCGVGSARAGRLSAPCRRPGRADPPRPGPGGSSPRSSGGRRPRRRPSRGTACCGSSPPRPPRARPRAGGRRGRWS